MGGEGSMMHMINTLKNNKSMLSKRKERRGLQGKYSGEKLEFENSATKTDLEQIRLRLKQENKQKQIRVLIVFGILMVLVLSVFVYFF
ncbi:hypothetical protein [Hanstruepera marina]|uniref:hypothetical protein n=1 Tax=Hanstruepera marina TaxID=2873265 RepID=UPI001CA67F22|nr:hypothetical protein [Hanstruepera marina]